MAPSHRPSQVKRALGSVGRGLLTLGVLGLAGGGIVFGVSLLNDRAAAVTGPEAAAPLPVQVAQVTIDKGYTVPRRFIGQIEARTDVALSFELGGRLQDLTVEEGDFVAEGDVLARLDTDLLRAEEERLRASRAATEAQLTFAEARLARAVQLQGEGFTSRDTLDQAIAQRDELSNRIAETDAALRAVAINLEKSVLTAPFSGQIAVQAVDPASTVQSGQTIVSVMETARPEFRVGLPLDLAPEALAGVEVEVAGRRLPATLTRLRPDIDPLTRTRTAIFALETSDPLLFGQTAVLTLDMEVPAEGTWVPLDALQAGKGSVWSVLVVADARLQRATVELLHIEGARAYVRGTLRDGDEVVLSGAHRVVPGQTVDVLRGEG